METTHPSKINISSAGIAEYITDQQPGRLAYSSLSCISEVVFFSFNATVEFITLDVLACEKDKYTQSVRITYRTIMQMEPELWNT